MLGHELSFMIHAYRKFISNRIRKGFKQADGNLYNLMYIVFAFSEIGRRYMAYFNVFIVHCR